MTTASTPAFSQASILARACFWAWSSRPIWWTSAPQHPAPAATTTWQPRRVNSRTVASLIPGLSTCCAQPVIRATRLRRLPLYLPWASKTRGRSMAEAAGTRAGARSTIPFSRPGNIALKGRPRAAALSARRNTPGDGTTKASRALSILSGHGRAKVCSMRARARSIRCM